MAELVYNEQGRLLFTEEMKREYTLLMPQMLPVHFTMLKRVFELQGYKVDMLTTNHRGPIRRCRGMCLFIKIPATPRCWSSAS